MPDALRDAAVDLRILLSKGYKRSSAVRFVADRYRLCRTDRLALFRCVYPEDVAEVHLRKLVPAEDLRGATISVDGFNILRTVYAALHGRPLYLCDDGFVRDISTGLSKPKFGDLVECLGLVIPCICDLRTSFAIFVYDRPVSRSGDLSKKTEELMGAKGVPGASKTSMRPDSEILACGDVVATSDSVVIARASKCFDLGGYLVSKILGSPPTKI
ncbi:MAG: DUF434 domain-containing protein [Candidatus Methanosuratincola sp.]|jgi:hypothetical protein|uniref:DUF434 domain-containing protein n=1 Tax=Methanosuratincola subterraneus TaxID=2593994 RepID=A0A3S4UFN6_METS7|nr:DUF434 domain-containing protein [Candidatus Methanosuratincola sp.]RWX72840.1 MAG: hypothetical protein Metus_0814 [Candidatus Methanosuratincola subterraneus]